VRPAGARAHPHLQQKTPRHEGRVTAAHHKPPRRLASRRDEAERANLFTGLAARRAFGTMLDGAARGVPQPFLQMFPRTQIWRKHWDDAAWGSHDPRLPLAQRDAASPMRRRRRDALGHGGSKARAQAG
jgi:hypothetical protein